MLKDYDIRFNMLLLSQKAALIMQLLSSYAVK